MMPIDQIIGEKLSAVVFVMDCVQLQFDGPVFNVLTPITVVSSRSTVRSGEDQFRNSLCEQIAKRVTRVSNTDTTLRIDFSDASAVLVSLGAEDCTGPEAVVFYSDENELVVIRPNE